MTQPKYPELEVQLTGEDGNMFIIVSRVRSAIERYVRADQELSADPDEVSLARDTAKAEGEAFFEEALSGNSDHVLETIQKWVKVL